MNVRSRHTSKKRGTRKWLFAWEMDKLFGKNAAELMRIRKLESEELKETEVRYHPDLPEEEAGFCLLRFLNAGNSNAKPRLLILSDEFQAII